MRWILDLLFYWKTDKVEYTDFDLGTYVIRQTEGDKDE